MIDFDHVIHGCTVTCLRRVGAARIAVRLHIPQPYGVEDSELEIAIDKEDFDKWQVNGQYTLSFEKERV